MRLVYLTGYVSVIRHNNVGRVSQVSVHMCMLEYIIFMF